MNARRLLDRVELLVRDAYGEQALAELFLDDAVRERASARKARSLAILRGEVAA